MNYTNAMNVYYENSVETQTKGRIVVKLYEGAISFLYQAEDGFVLKEGQKVIDFEKINVNLIKAQAIIIELRGSLNHNAGELAKQLETIYDYMYETLVEANIEKNLNKVIEVRMLLEDLSKAWNQIA